MLVGNHGLRIINQSGDPNASVVLNSAANGLVLSGNGWTLQGISSQKFMLNFYQATSLTFGRSYYASVLAPFADLAGANGSADGQFFFNSFSGSYSFSYLPFTGELPDTIAAVPEPASGIIAACGLLALALRRRRVIHS